MCSATGKTDRWRLSKRNEPAKTWLSGLAKDKASHAVEFACRVEAVQERLEVDVPPDAPPQHTGIANQHRRRAPTLASF